MKKRWMTGLLALCTVLLVSCGSVSGNEPETPETGAGSETERVQETAEKEMSELSFFAMDTYMDVKVLDEPDGSLAAEVEAEVARIEDLMSVTIEESDLYRVNHAGGQTVTVSDEVADLLSRSLQYCEETDGALNIAIYPLSVAWGFSSASEEGFRIVPEEERQELLPLCRWEDVQLDGTSVTTPDGSGVDLGGIAKGYALDRSASLLREEGADTALLYMGGDIYAVGAKEDGSAWRVAVQDPEDETGASYAGVLEVTDTAVVTSGSYERYFDDEETGIRYHHILDSGTGAPAESGLTSVTIVCEDATRADALATALFDMGAERALDYWRSGEDFEVILITEEDDLYVTEGLEEIFTASGTWKAQIVGR